MIVDVLWRLAMWCCAQNGAIERESNTADPRRQSMPRLTLSGRHRPRTVHAAARSKVKGEDALASGTMELSNGVVVELHAVFDGHGGAESARFCARSISQYVHDAYEASVAHEASMEERYRRALVDAFARLHKEVSAAGIKDGTTATVVLVDEDRIVVGSVGDSMCYFFPADAEPKDQRQCLSADHRIVAASETELVRVQKAGGKLARATASDGKTPVGPTRLYPGGLMMTRSIGDADSSAAAIAVPEVSVREWPDGGGTLVLASDGIWDFLELPTLSRLVEMSRAPRLGSAWLARSVLVSAKEKNHDDDDASIICVQLRHKKKAKSSRSSRRTSFADARDAVARASHGSERL